MEPKCLQVNQNGSTLEPFLENNGSAHRAQTDRQTDLTKNITTSTNAGRNAEVEVSYGP